MTAKDCIDLIEKTANKIGLDINLALAVAGHESNFDPSKIRYEPNWKYWMAPETMALQLGITAATERIMQSCSWGCLQVMGTVARELGYSDQLPLLMQPEIGTLFGCRKLQSCAKIYRNEKDAISAYNQGSPGKINGVYKNIDYVDEVYERLTKLRLIG